MLNDKTPASHDLDHAYIYHGPPPNLHFFLGFLGGPTPLFFMVLGSSWCIYVVYLIASYILTPQICNHLHYYRHFSAIGALSHSYMAIKLLVWAVFFSLWGKSWSLNKQRQGCTKPLLTSHWRRNNKRCGKMAKSIAFLGGGRQHGIFRKEHVGNF